MNPLGLHAMVWVGDWSRQSATTAVKNTAAAGFDLIEIPLLDPASVDTTHTQQLLTDHGLQAACSLGLSPTTDVSSEDPSVVAAGKERLTAAVDTAAALGARQLCGVLYSNLGKYAQPASPLSRQHAAETMAWLADYAAASGLPVALEVVNRYETNLVNTCTDMAQFIQETGRDLTLHLDTYHMNIEEDGFAKPVLEHADRLGYVHIGESHRGYLGTGTIDFDSFFDALARVGYDGVITFESFSSAVVHPELSNTLGVWRNLWSDSTDLAKHAHQFMVEQLQRTQQTTVGI
jgi:D-psicose/D-tagatose/L-ribulose 3-epimerase